MCPRSHLIKEYPSKIIVVQHQQMVQTLQSVIRHRIASVEEISKLSAENARKQLRSKPETRSTP